MTKAEFKERIKGLALSVYSSRQRAEEAAVEYDELTKFPELKEVILSLLTSDFNNFLSSIDWVAPRPTTFRINLRNDENFYLIWMGRSWIAQVEGKKYYLLNLPEEERAVEAIARILRYGKPVDADVGVDTESDDVDDTTDVEIDDTTDVEIDA